MFQKRRLQVERLPTDHAAVRSTIFPLESQDAEVFCQQSGWVKICAVFMSSGRFSSWGRWGFVAEPTGMKFTKVSVYLILKRKRCGAVLTMICFDLPLKVEGEMKLDFAEVIEQFSAEVTFVGAHFPPGGRQCSIQTCHQNCLAVNSHVTRSRIWDLVDVVSDWISTRFDQLSNTQRWNGGKYLGIDWFKVCVSVMERCWRLVEGRVMILVCQCTVIVRLSIGRL